MYNKQVYLSKMIFIHSFYLSFFIIIAITRDSRHKRRATGGRRHPHQKKRKFEVGRPPAMTKLGAQRVHLVRGRGGNLKYRALRLEEGNYSWGTENVTKPTRIIDVVYNASNNELVRTKTLVKNAVVLVDATPFRQYYEAHYKSRVTKKQVTEEGGAKYNRESLPVAATASKATQAKYAERKAELTKKVDPKIEEQLVTGRLLAVISSRPGQAGRADGYILEGSELEFYQRKIAQKKTK